MSDPNSEDKWGELAKTIGAEVRPEPPEQAPPISPIKPRIPISRAPVEPPKKLAAGWDQLRDEFGLPAPVEETAKRAVPSAVSPSPSQDEAPPARSPQQDVPLPKSRPTERRPERTERRDRGGRTERTESAPQRRAQRPASRDEQPQSEKSRAEKPRPEASERPPRPVAPPPAPPSVAPIPTPSITPAPAEPPRSNYGLPDWFPFARKRDTSTPRVETPPAPQPPELREFVEEHDETTLEEEVVEIDAVDSQREDAEEGDSQKGKRRRPRRRRRGGKKQSEGSATTRGAAPKQVESVVVDLGPAGHDVELFDDDEDVEENLSSDDGHDEEDEEGTGSSGSRSGSHRNIPSWGEAIGVVVDANLATRSERKKTARPTNGGRGGRPRGRRKK